MDLARWRDGEIARREEIDSEIDFLTKRKRGKEDFEQRGKEKKRILNKEEKRKRE